VALKPKASKEELKELAGQAVVKLELEVSEYQEQIKLLLLKIDDCERKVRWVKRELLEA
jgi:hypothetical protein